MSLTLTLDELSEIPIYQQIVDQIEKSILNSDLQQGNYLPSVRDLAVKNQVNPNTISKAYQKLQVLGLVESVRGLGLKVLPLNAKLSESRRKELLNNSIEALLKMAHSLQVSNEALLSEIRKKMKTNPEALK